MIYAGAVALSVAVFFFRFAIVEWLYTDSTTEFGVVLGWLMFSFIGVSGTYIFGSLLTANGSLNRLNWIFVFGIIINLVLNLILIPKSGAEGAAIATLVTQMLVFFSQLFLTKWEMGFGLSGEVMARSGIYFFACLGVIYLLSQLDIMPWQMLFLGAIIVQLALAVLLKLVNFKFLFEFIPRK
ncbi:MAG: polysaccharide biosynthesis C-terminal domain-containing protein [Saprospiraceae bacterium]